MIVGVGVFVINAGNEPARVAQVEVRLSRVLGEAKEALVAAAVAHATRPGALPCPDTNDDGTEEAMVAGQCPAYLGRVPWVTLGLGEATDSAGERLWYALSPNFRDFAAINSDTKGDRIVRTGNGAVTLTGEAAAVIFAPGGIVGGQTRTTAAAPCPTTGTIIPQNLCATNYLDVSGATNNASAGGPFIAAAQSGRFNDRLVVVSTSDFMPFVERRVAGDIRRALVTYRETSRSAIAGGGCNCYPWPDSDADGTSNTGRNHGRVPLTAAPHNWSRPGAPSTLAAGGIVYTLPELPTYVQPNNWAWVIYYAVGRNALQNFGLAPTVCSTCTADPLLPPPPLLRGTLSVDQGIGHAVVLITPGSAGASRPSNNWGDYIDDPRNRDADDRFVTPASSSLDRDRLFTLSDDVPPGSCSTSAQMLIYNAPCHTTGNNVKAVCAKAASNLQFCTCSGRGTEMISPPCRNTLNPPQCQAAVADLQGCKL